MIVITLQDILGLIIVGLMIIFLIVYLIVLRIKACLDSIFKKNCYDCKHYELYDTCGSGSYCKYKCNKKDRVDDENINSSIHYEKCDDFEKGGNKKYEKGFNNYGHYNNYLEDKEENNENN